MAATMRRAVAALSCSALLLLSTALADVDVTTPLQQQLPPIAHTGTPYSWTLVSDTFSYMVGDGQQAPASPPSIVYAASGMPSWLAFDAGTRTFSGTVPDGGSGSKTTITVNGSIADAQAATGTNTSATDSFSLLTLSAPAPTLAIPIAQQLLGASNSLGTSNLLPNNVLHIPPGWSFSVGLQWDTFTLPNGNDVYWTANLAGGADLPSWMDWSPSTFDLSGVAPVNIPSAGQEYDVVFTASNRPGYGGTSDTLHILVSSNTLTAVNGTLDAVDAAVGIPFASVIDESLLRADGRPITSNRNVTVSADLSSSSLSWLSFTSTNNTLSGTPPYNLYGQANDTTAVEVPITFKDATAGNLLVNKTVMVAPYAFTAEQLPNVVVQPGKQFSVDLHSYIRNIGTSANATANTKTAAVIQIVMQTPNVTTTYTPANSSSWIAFNNSTLTLTGTVPQDYTQRVQVMLNANGTSTAKGAASFYLTVKGDNAVGNPTGTGDPSSNSPNGSSSNGGSHGLSKGAKAAIGVCVGLIGLVALLLLLCCCRRRIQGDKTPKEKDAIPVVDAHNTSTTDGDDRTLTDETQFTKMLKAIKMARSRTPNTPSTFAVTPRQEEKTTPVVGDDSMGSRGVVVVESPNGGRRDATNEAEEPVQHGIFSNLFQGGRARPANGGRRRESHGLGLSLGGAAAAGAAGAALGSGMASRGSGRMRHQRSRNSVISQRSSWENDLFYEDNGQENEPVEQLQSSSGGQDEVPRRRGLAEAAPLEAVAFRHRHKHDSKSPAFEAQDAFGQSQDREADGMPQFESDSSLSHGQHIEAYGGLHPDSHGDAEGDARIMEARLMQVQRHSPMLHQGGNFQFFQRSSQHSHDAVVRDAPTVYSQDDGDEHIFDDAEDDPSSHVWHGSRADRGPDGRNSALSAATGSHHHGRTLIAAAGTGTAAHDQRMPNPSFMDGASITGIDPSESVRRVNPRPQTPPRPSSAASSAASRHLICPLIPATVGHLVNFHMYPNTPPPMAGAPGSPGKRSGRNVRYELIVEDPRPHLARYRGQWPAMLSDWLSFDQSTFEVVGVVPRGAGLELLGDCEIALISIGNASRQANAAMPRPSFERKRTSQTSYDSARSNLDDEGGDIVARARLVFHGTQGQAF